MVARHRRRLKYGMASAFTTLGVAYFLGWVGDPAVNAWGAVLTGLYIILDND